MNNYTFSFGTILSDRCGPNRRYELQFHQPHLFTTADGTTYKMSYYWAAVGVGGVYKWLTEEESRLMATATRGNGFGISWHSIVTPYEEEWRIYSKMVEVRDPRYFGSGIINGLNGFAMANGVKTNLFEAAVRYNYKSARSWKAFNQLRPEQQKFRYVQTLGKEGRLYLKGFKNLGVGMAFLSGAMEVGNYYLYRKENSFDWKVATKVGFDLIMSAVGFFGPVGLAISSAYFVLDVATDGFGGFGKMY